MDPSDAIRTDRGRNIVVVPLSCLCKGDEPETRIQATKVISTTCKILSPSPKSKWFSFDAATYALNDRNKPRAFSKANKKPSFWRNITHQKAKVPPYSLF
jgi:hypothetical protein